MTAIFDAPATGLTEQEQDWVDHFMDETTLSSDPTRRSCGTTPSPGGPSSRTTASPRASTR